MTANEELNKALYDKMSAEMERYREELLSMPPDEILKNAYEYAVREDILLTMENYDLDDERARALLVSETPLSDAFQAVESENIGYTDMIQRCVWKKANSPLWEKRMAARPENDRPQETPPEKKPRSGRRKSPTRQSAAWKGAISMNAKRADVAVSGGKTDARKALYDRMCAERRAFRESLLAMPPEDALRNARRHFIMDKIILFVGTHDLGDGRVRALLNMERPLESALDAAESLDAVNEETIRERLERCADGQADSERERRKAMREAPVYPHGAETAAFGGHWEEYCASRAANVACRNAIEEAVSARYDGYDGSRVSVEAVREVAEAFGFERTLRVLANSVQWREREFSGDNLSWALSIPISQDEAGCEHNRNADYVVRTHPDILDGFISVARREYERELSPPPERQEGDKAPPDASKGQSRKCAKGKKRPER